MQSKVRHILALPLFFLLFLFKRILKLVKNDTKTYLIKCGVSTNGVVDLTALDDMLCGIYITSTFFYENTLDVEAVKISLQQTLAHYPTLCGRLVKGNSTHTKVKLNDAGLQFAVVNLSTPLPKYGPDMPAYGDVNKYCQAHPVRSPVDRDAPLCYITVTQFSGGGSAIGVLMSHALTDGVGNSDFFRNWSHQARFGKMLNEPIHDRSYLYNIAASAPPLADDYIPQGMVVRNSWTKIAAIAKILYNLVTMRILIYHVTKEELEKMKAQSSVGLPKDEWITTNQAVYSRIWKIVTAVRILNGTIKKEEEHALICTQSIRHLYPASEHIFANLTQNCEVAQPAQKVVEMKPSDCTLQIKRAYASTSVEVVAKNFSWNFNTYYTAKYNKIYAGVLVNQNSFFVNDYSRFSFYELDFGSGGPFWYDIPKVPLDAAIIAPSRDGGRDLHISLSKKDYATLNSQQWRDAFVDNEVYDRLVTPLLNK